MLKSTGCFSVRFPIGLAGAMGTALVGSPSQGKIFCIAAGGWTVHRTLLLPPQREQARTSSSNTRAITWAQELFLGCLSRSALVLAKLVLGDATVGRQALLERRRFAPCASVQLRANCDSIDPVR